MRFLLARVDEGTRQRLLDQAKINLSPAGAR